MPKMSRRDSEAQRQAVLQWWLTHPDQTGDEVQEALVTGRMTGARGPAISLRTLCELRKQAQGMAKSSGRPVSQAGYPIAQANSAALASLREHVRAIQLVLPGLPDIQEVRITRDGARLTKLAPTDEAL